MHFHPSLPSESATSFMPLSLDAADSRRGVRKGFLLRMALSIRAFSYFASFALFFWGVSAAAQPDSPYAKTAGEHLENVTVEPELGRQVNLDRQFVNSNGQAVSLRSAFLPDKPLVLVPAYYGCPMLCGLLNTGVADLVKQLPLGLGEEYAVATVSFDPTETEELSSKAKQSFTKDLSEAGDVERGWSFFTGAEENIVPLMQEIGFGYKLVDGEYAHSAVIYVLTPEGKISQYFSGVDFSDRIWDVRLSLVEASKGSVGSFVDQALLFCMQFDPTKGKYSFVAFNIVRGGALLGLIALVIFLSVLWRREVKKGALKRENKESDSAKESSLQAHP